MRVQQKSFAPDRDARPASARAFQTAAPGLAYLRWRAHRSWFGQAYHPRHLLEHPGARVSRHASVHDLVPDDQRLLVRRTQAADLDESRCDESTTATRARV